MLLNVRKVKNVLLAYLLNVILEKDVLKK